MKILITGVAGLLGANFSRHLLDKGYTVVGVDSFFGGYKEFLPKHKNFNFYNIDLENTKKVKELFRRETPDLVYHFAAYASEGLSPFIRNFNYVNNVICSVNIINECIQRDIKIIFTSSMAVYGEQPTPFTESMLPLPVDPYGIAKYAVEMDLSAAFTQFGLRYTIIRPHNVVGRYQNIWDRYRNVIGIFIRKTLNYESLVVYGDGEQTRAFSDIKYYMEPLESVSSSIYNNEIFNLGADRYYSLNETAMYVQKIARKHGFNPNIEHVQPRHEVKHAYCDHNKAKQLLNFKDKTDIECLIEDMFIWAKGIPVKKVKKMEYEVTKNIYNFWK